MANFFDLISENPKTVYRIIFILYLISVSMSILSFVLSLIDKQILDSYMILDLVFEILLIISLTIGLFKKLGFLYHIILALSLTIYILVSIFSFWTYKNPKSKDFKSMQNWNIPLIELTSEVLNF